MADLDLSDDVSNDAGDTITSSVVLPSDKYGALVDAYARKSHEHKVLRSAVVRVRAEKADLESQLTAAQAAAAAREHDLRAYADEVDRLASLHEAATKRVAALQAAIEESRAAAAAPRGSMLGALLSSANWEAAELARVSGQLKATGAELELKVAENEAVHMALFEARQAADAAASTAEGDKTRLRDQVDQLGAALRAKDAAAAAATLRVVAAERRLGVASQRYATTVAAARAEAAWLSSARRSLAARCEALRGRLAFLLPIDDRAVAAVARWDAVPRASPASAAGASLGAWEGRAALLAEAGGPVTAGARGLCALLLTRAQLCAAAPLSSFPPTLPPAAGDAAFDATAAAAAAFVRRNTAAAAGAAAAPPFLAAVVGLLGVCAGAARLAPALARRAVGLDDDDADDVEQGDAEDDDGAEIDDGGEGDLSSPPIATPTFMTALNSSSSSQLDEGPRRRQGAAAVAMKAGVLEAAEALGLLLPVRARRPGAGDEAASHRRDEAASHRRDEAAFHRRVVPPAPVPPLSPAAVAPLACIYTCAAFLKATHGLLAGAAPALDAAAASHAAWAASAVREEATRASQRHADASRPATPVSSAAAAASESRGSGRYSGLDSVGPAAAPIEDGGAEEDVVRAVRQSARLVASSAARAPTSVEGQKTAASRSGSVASSSGRGGAFFAAEAPPLPDSNALEVLRALDRGARARTDELGVLAAALEAVADLHRARAVDLSSRLAASTDGGGGPNASLFEASFNSGSQKPLLHADAAATALAAVLRLCEEGSDAEASATAPAPLVQKQQHAVGVGPSAPPTTSPTSALQATALDARWQALDVAVSAALLLPRGAAPLGLYAPLARLTIGGKGGSPYASPSLSRARSARLLAGLAADVLAAARARLDTLRAWAAAWAAAEGRAAEVWRAAAELLLPVDSAKPCRERRYSHSLSPVARDGDSGGSDDEEGHHSSAKLGGGSAVGSQTGSFDDDPGDQRRRADTASSSGSWEEEEEGGYGECGAMQQAPRSTAVGDAAAEASLAVVAQCLAAAWQRWADAADDALQLLGVDAAAAAVPTDAPSPIARARSTLVLPSHPPIGVAAAADAIALDASDSLAGETSLAAWSERPEGRGRAANSAASRGRRSSTRSEGRIRGSSSSSAGVAAESVRRGAAAEEVLATVDARPAAVRPHSAGPTRRRTPRATPPPLLPASLASPGAAGSVSTLDDGKEDRAVAAYGAHRHPLWVSPALSLQMLPPGDDDAPGASSATAAAASLCLPAVSASSTAVAAFVASAPLRCASYVAAANAAALPPRAVHGATARAAEAAAAEALAASERRCAAALADLRSMGDSLEATSIELQMATAALDIARSQLMSRTAEAALDGSRSGHLARTPGGAGAPLLTDSLRIGPAPAQQPQSAAATTQASPAAMTPSSAALDMSTTPPHSPREKGAAAKATAAAALWRSRLEAGQRAWAADRRELEAEVVTLSSRLSSLRHLTALDAFSPDALAIVALGAVEAQVAVGASLPVRAAQSVAIHAAPLMTDASTDIAADLPASAAHETRDAATDVAVDLPASAAPHMMDAATDTLAPPSSLVADAVATADASTDTIPPPALANAGTQSQCPDAGRDASVQTEFDDGRKVASAAFPSPSPASPPPHNNTQPDFAAAITAAIAEERARATMELQAALSAAQGRATAAREEALAAEREHAAAELRAAVAAAQGRSARELDSALAAAHARASAERERAVDAERGRAAAARDAAVAEARAVCAREAGAAAAEAAVRAANEKGAAIADATSRLAAEREEMQATHEAAMVATSDAYRDQLRAVTARAAEAEAWIRSIERRTAELEECAVRCGRCGGWATLPALLAGAGVCPNRACGRALEAFRPPQQQAGVRR